MAGWGRCRDCRQPIWFGPSPFGGSKSFPFDDEDEQVKHFDTCASQPWVTDPDGNRQQVGRKGCSLCGAKLWWQTTPSGKRRPMNIDGDEATWECHFDTCAGRVTAEDYDEVWARGHQREPSGEPESAVGIAALWLPDLGLTWPVTLPEVTTAFRRLAMKHHPDTGGDGKSFMRIKLAYDRLKQILQEVPA